MSEIYTEVLNEFLKTHGPSLTASSANGFDDTIYSELADAAYEAELAYQQNPNQNSAMTYMQAASALATYLQNNPPPQNPPSGSAAENANAVLASLNQQIYPGVTLAQELAKTDQTTINWVISNPSISSPLFNNLAQAPNVYPDMQNPDLAADIKDSLTNLLSFLNNYTYNASQINPNYQFLCLDATGIAVCLSEIQQFASQLHDGFLTAIISTLSNPCSSGGSSLLSLSAAAKGGDPTALQNLVVALNSMGENQTGGGSLTTLLQTAFNEEPWPS